MEAGGGLGTPGFGRRKTLEVFSWWRTLEACRLQKEGTLEADTRKQACSR